MNANWWVLILSLSGFSLIGLAWKLPWLRQSRKARREQKREARCAAWQEGDHEHCPVSPDEADLFTRIAGRYPNLGKEVER